MEQTERQFLKTRVLAVSPAGPLPPLVLEVLGGLESGKRFEIRMGRSHLGRSDQNEVRLVDDTVSQMHATIDYVTPSRIRVYDAASTNGIASAGRRSPQIDLRVGETLQVGSFFLRLTDPGRSRSAKHRTFHAVIAAFALAAVGFLSGLGSPIPWSATSSPRTPAGPVALQVAHPQKPVAKPALTPKRHTARIVSVKTLSRPRKHTPVESAPSSASASTLAAEAFNAGDYRRAFALWTEVLRTDPENGDAAEGFEKLESVANRLYEEALMVSATSAMKARLKLEDALSITQPRRPLNEKVERALREWS